MLLLQLVINGLQLGAIYALTAVGFSLIFGATKVFHVAHGATFTIAGYLFWWIYAVLHVAWPLAALAAVIAAVVFGLAMERFIYRPIQRHEGAFFTVFIAAFGMQIIVQNLTGTIFGRGFASVTTGLSRSVEVLPGLFVAPVAWISLLVALVFFVAGCGGALERMRTATFNPSAGSGASPSQFTSRRLIQCVCRHSRGPTTTCLASASRRTT